MFDFNVKKKELVRIKNTNLTEENLKERYDLQKAIKNSWEEIRDDLGLENTFLIGEEIRPRKNFGDAIDLLGYDQNDNCLVIMELKRNKDKYQLLQTLNYAALLSQWDKKTLLDNIKSEDDKKQLAGSINSIEFNFDIKIILISEKFGSEIILTTEWLTKKYNLNIVIVQILMFKDQDKIKINFNQLLPFQEIDELFDKKKNVIINKIKDYDWDHWKKIIKYDFGRDAIQWCLDQGKDGDPNRGRFTSFRTKFKNYEWVSLNFRIKHLTVYLKGNPNDAEMNLRKSFSDRTELSQWRDGWSLKIKNEDDFNDLKKWLI